MAKKYTPKQANFARIRRNIVRRINDAKRRGYSFPTGIVPNVPEKVTKKALSLLENLSKNLYQYGEYTDPATGATVTGTKGRELERSDASKRAAATRRMNREIARSGLLYDWDTDDYDPVDESLRQLKGDLLEAEIDERITPAGKYYTPPTESDEVLRNVFNLLNRYGTSGQANWSAHLKAAKMNDVGRAVAILEHAIEDVGYAAVARNMQADPQRLNAILEVIMYWSDEEAVEFNTHEFVSMALGRALSPSDNAAIHDIMESFEEY